MWDLGLEEVELFGEVFGSGIGAEVVLLQQFHQVLLDLWPVNDDQGLEEEGEVVPVGRSVDVAQPLGGRSADTILVHRVLDVNVAAGEELVQIGLGHDEGELLEEAAVGLCQLHTAGFLVTGLQENPRGHFRVHISRFEDSRNNHAK